MSEIEKSQAQKVIDRFGGVRAMAAQTRWPEQTIYSWLKRGSIPSWRMDYINEKFPVEDQPAS